MGVEIGIIGNGGQADEAASYHKGEVKFRAVSSEYVDKELIDIAKPSDEQASTKVVLAIGAPAVRRFLESEWPGDKYETIVSEHAVVDKSAQIGRGSIIAPRAVITTNVLLGEHNIVNVGSTIQHDSKLGDFVTISPGVNIGGNVRIGSGVFIGIGANISNDVVIADGVVLGAGATVPPHINLVKENGVYVGSPARIVKQNPGWLSEI